MVAPNIFKPHNDWNVISFRCKKQSIKSIEIRIAHIVEVEMGYDPLSDKQYQGTPICKSRQVYQFMLKKHLNMTLTSIGRMTGNKKHCTILSSINAVKNYYDTDMLFRKSFNNIDNEIIRLLK